MKTPKQWSYRMLNTISHDSAMKKFEDLDSFAEDGWEFKNFAAPSPATNELEFKAAFKAGALDWINKVNKS